VKSSRDGVRLLTQGRTLDSIAVLRYLKPLILLNSYAKISMQAYPLELSRLI